MSTLYEAPIGIVGILILLVVLGALEAGRWLSRVVPAGERQFSTISAVILALVGLLIAFSFSMAAERYSLRRERAVQEVNAIGTFWLRTALLPDPVGPEMRSLLCRYVDLHFEHREAELDAARLAAAEGEAHRVQEELWSLLAEESRRSPEALSLLLVTPSLNAMIDDTASVLAARENRLPDALLLVLLMLVAVSGFVIGYGSRAEKRSPILWGALVAVLGGTLVTLVDMDRPRGGLIDTSVSPYVRLYGTLEEDCRGGR